MAAYATVQDVQARMTRTLSLDEITVCETLLEDAAAIIDAYTTTAAADARKIVSCRMVVRALGDGADGAFPIGATQGSQSALGYSQSWSVPAGGGAGELYLNRVDKLMLGHGNQIGSHSPTEDMAAPEVWP